MNKPLKIGDAVQYKGRAYVVDYLTYDGVTGKVRLQPIGWTGRRISVWIKNLDEARA